MSNFNNEFEQLELFDFFNDTVNESIHDLLCYKLLEDEEQNFSYDALMFYPVYTRKPTDKIKTLKCVYAKLSDQEDFTQLSLKDIDYTGANWLEFLDYLYLSDARLVFFKDVL